MNEQSIGPTYLCRKRMILEKIKKFKSSSILEIGCGNGDLISTLSYNHSCTAIDLNRKNIQGLIDKGIPGVFLWSDLFKFNPNKKYDLVLCFEVIEHIKDDSSAIKKLVSYLKTNGTLMISVPAKQKKFGDNDILGGHLRRYELSDIKKLAASVKLHNIKVYSIGFPIANIVKYYNDYRAHTILSHQQENNQKLLTTDSGIKSGRFFGILGSFMMFPFYLLQKIFSQTSWGINYLMIAEK